MGGQVSDNLGSPGMWSADKDRIVRTLVVTGLHSLLLRGVSPFDTQYPPIPNKEGLKVGLVLTSLNPSPSDTYLGSCHPQVMHFVRS